MGPEALMDTVDKKVRSRIMSSIKSVSELERRAAKRLSKLVGCRLRHQPMGIEGRPDFANKARMVCIFVHGCFWHQPCPLGCSKMPKSRRAFWRRKFARNAERHRESVDALREAGWEVWTIWEHDLKMVSYSRELR